MKELDIIVKSTKDFFTFKMLQVTLVPFLITFILIYVMFFAAADYSISTLQEVAQASANHEEIIIDENAPFYYKWASESLVFLFQYSITSWLAGFFLYVFGTIFVLKFSIILTIAILGFLTPYIVNIIHKKHYSNLEVKGHGTIFDTFYVLVKSTVVMIVLFVFLIPLYFIPIINIIAFSFPFYYFFHKLLNSDVASNILSKEEFAYIYKRTANSYRLRTAFLYFISLIPFMTMFVAVFFVIYLAHAYFNDLINIQNTNKNLTNI